MELEWAGWRGNTATLQRHGWSFSADQNLQTRMLHLALHHDQYGATGYGRIPYEYHRKRLDFGYYQRADQPQPIGIEMGRDVRVYCEERPSFIPVDATPSWFSTEDSLQALAHFAPMKSLAAPFVLPEQDVDQLLSLILEKQQAAKTDYFRDLVRKEGATLPEHTMSAQIISLKAA